MIEHLRLWHLEELKKMPWPGQNLSLTPCSTIKWLFFFQSELMHGAAHSKLSYFKMMVLLYYFLHLVINRIANAWQDARNVVLPYLEEDEKRLLYISGHSFDAALEENTLLLQDTQLLPVNLLTDWMICCRTSYLKWFPFAVSDNAAQVFSTILQQHRPAKLEHLILASFSGFHAGTINLILTLLH